MPNKAQVFEEPLEIEIGLLEPGPPTAESYPYPSLAVTSQLDRRVFQSVVLENRYLRLTLVPALGGRVLRLLDKCTGVEIYGSDLLQPKTGGRRGAYIEHGLLFSPSGEHSLTAMAPVSFGVVEPENDADQAAVWLAEAGAGTGLGWHCRFSLKPDKAAVDIEVRAQNRTLEPLLYMGTFLGLCPVLTLLEGSRVFAARSAHLAPRQVDTFDVVLVPHPNVVGQVHVGTAGVIGMGEDQLSIHAIEPIPEAQVFLALEDGQTVEAKKDLHPEHRFTVAFKELPANPIAALVRNSEGSDVMSTTMEIAGRNPAEPPSPNYPSSGDPRYRLDIRTRHAALLREAHDAISARNFSRAELLVEQALVYNGDDPLGWWLKAVLARLQGRLEERPELLNAHYLAPLEPALRAEAFLSQPQEMSKEPNPLVAPLTDVPEQFIEVASLLLEANLLEEASRWIDEALRHQPLAMLHYLQAFCLLEGTRMEAEAVRHIGEAGKLDNPYPLPWRTVETRAIERLLSRFPEDAKLQEITRLLSLRLPRDE